MPKVVIYVRADDARIIEATEGRAIDAWVRTLVRDSIHDWHAQRLASSPDRPMPEAWRQHQESQGEPSH